ncbi:MAG: glycosyltransferase family 4 protein [Oscillospiraceae bacterium]
MKVLMVNKFHYRKGGSETYYFTLAEAMKAMGHEVIFFAMEDKKNIPCEQEEYFVSNASVNGGIKSKLKIILHLTYSREAYKKMTQLLQAEKPDLVILNLVHKQITLSIIDAIKEHDPKLPIFWTMHDLIAVCPSYTMRDGNGNICEKCLGGDFSHCVQNKCIKGSSLMSLLSKHEAEFIRRKKWYDRVDLYICPSEFYRRKLTEGKFTKSPIVTMRNPLPIGTEFDVSEADEGYVLYFGRLSPEKGVKTLIEAAKLCGCHLVILGTGPQEAELKACAEGFTNIEFKGFQTGATLKRYVRNSRCVVMPSACYENGPYSAMEAMTMGKPLIVSNRGGLPELVEDGVNGYIFDGKAQELADRICQMQMLSKEQYIQMGRTSLEKAQGLFDAKAYIKQIESYYIESKTRKGFQS